MDTTNTDTAEDLTVRASSMPLAMVCPGSVRGGLGVAVDPYHPASETGVCAHEVFRQIADEELDDLPDSFEQTCSSYSVSADDLRPMMHTVLRCWQSIRSEYPNSIGEQQMSAQIVPGLTVTGRPDRYSLVKDGNTTIIRVFDLKSGFLDTDAQNQIRTYWALVWSTVDGPVKFQADLCRPRLDAHDQMAWSEATMLKWLGRVRDEVYQWDSVYRPGSHCYRCPLALACEARDKMMAGMAKDIASTSESSPVRLAMIHLNSTNLKQRMAAGEYLHRLMEMGKTISERCDSIREVIKRTAKDSGPVPISRDKEWRITQTRRARVNVGDAADVVGEHLPEFLKAAWLTQSAVTALAKRLGIDPKALLQDLDAAGALRSSSTDSMRVCNIITAPKGTAKENTHGTNDK